MGEKQCEPGQDPDYDFVKPLATIKKGVQCGECWIKFDYNSTYGYVCQRLNCPMGFGAATCSAANSVVTP